MLIHPKVPPSFPVYSLLLSFARGSHGKALFTLTRSLFGIASLNYLNTHLVNNAVFLAIR